MSIVNTVKRWAMNLLNIVMRVRPELPIDTSYYTYISNWKAIYKGYYESWHKLTNSSTGKSRRLSSMKVAKLLCQEVASLIFSENVEIKIDNETIQDYVNDVFENNDFYTNYTNQIELMLALGGMVTGAIRANDKTEITFVNADSFVPLNWTNSMVTSGITKTDTVRGQFIYSLLTEYNYQNGVVTIQNRLVRSRADSEDSAIEVSLSTIYPDLPPVIMFENAQVPMIDYAKPNIANNIDLDSPLGISLFANSLDTLKALDICFDSYIREFQLGRKRIIVPATALREVTDPESGQKFRYFDDTVDVYEGLNLDDDKLQKIQDNTQTLRVEEHVSAINAFLNILCVQIGVTPGFISFDPATGGLKTATEVISENSKTFRTKKNLEKALRKNLKRLVRQITTVGVLYTDIPSIDYNIEIIFDDSIVEDRAAEMERFRLDVASGLRQPWEYRVKFLGETEEVARAMLGANGAQLIINDNA